MLFGKIDYINLLPFSLFLKGSSLPNKLKHSMEYKKSFPSKINKEFRSRRVDGAFISSIESKRGNIKKHNLGIIAKTKVTSVLVCKGKDKADPHSATSNKLAQILGLRGEVVIGDKALVRYINNPHECIDLAQKWYDKYRLPFVFARLCTNKNHKTYSKLVRKFNNHKQKIPQYILDRYSKQRKIDKKEILKYLKLLDYKIGQKESLSLKKFLKKT